MKRNLLLLFLCLGVSELLFGQRVISGKVTDESGRPLPNVSVIAKGTASGSSTDAEGNFRLSVSAGSKELLFSSVGYENTTVAIGSSSQLTVTLKQTSGELTGVVVTGYQKVKKSEYVGSATRIDKKAIEMVPNGSFDQILQGRAPGLRVSSGSGQPGSAAAVQIRGPKSISGGSTPLYVVDGMPVEASVFQSLNPNDFETVDVLKDASASGLYGSRGAAGAIVVTTKRGKKGQTTFSYRPQAGITQPGQQQFNMMTSSEILQFQEMLGMQVSNALPGWVFSRNNPAYAGLSPAVQAQYDRNLDSLRGINTNWRDIFQRSGRFQSHDINLSGGSDRTRFFSSLGYYDEQGIGQRSDLKRYTFRFNLDHQTDKLTFQLNTSVGYSVRNFIESENAIALANPFAAAYLALPYHDVYNASGNIITGAGRIGGNAFQRIRDLERYNGQLKSTSSLQFSYQLSPSIYAGAMAGFDFRQTINSVFLRPGSFSASQAAFPSNTGSYGDTYSNVLQGTTRGFTGYRSSFGNAKEHSVDVSLNAEHIFRKSRGFGYTGYGLNEKLPNTPAAITPGTIDNQLIPAVVGSRTERNFASFFALAKYSYENKYIVDLSLRRDGTSILPEANRFQQFFSAGVLWNVMKEGFAANWKNISTLRARLSYGSSANAENFPFNDFGYLPLYTSGSYAGNASVLPASPENPAGDWEYSDKANFGIEFGLWNERLTGTVDVYEEITRNLFLAQTIPLENGGAFGSAQVNAGKMRNRGIEVALNYDLVRARHVNWSLGGNFAYNSNKILSLGQESEYPLGTSIVRVGLPLGSHYINQWAGVDAATGRPLYLKADGKTITDQYNTEDQVANFGTFYAPWTGGFNTSVSWKGLELSAFFNFQAKFSRYNNQDFFQLNHAFAVQGYNLRREMLTMWQQPGDVTDIQSPLYQRQFSSKDIQDASYLRFRNILLAYNLPSSAVQKLKILKSARIYMQAQNLYTWTKWSGFDPEDNNNIAAYEYPLPRTYTVGLDINF